MDLNINLILSVGSECCKALLQTLSFLLQCMYMQTQYNSNNFSFSSEHLLAVHGTWSLCESIRLCSHPPTDFVCIYAASKHHFAL